MNSDIKIKISKHKTRNKKTEVDYLRCDNSLSLSKLRWKPGYNFEEGLQKTIHWFIKNYKSSYDNSTFKK